jgi:hypothetical protein
MLLAHLPHLRFDDSALNALPAQLRSLSTELIEGAALPRQDHADWDES